MAKSRSGIASGDLAQLLARAHSHAARSGSSFSAAALSSTEGGTGLPLRMASAAATAWSIIGACELGEGGPPPSTCGALARCYACTSPIADCQSETAALRKGGSAGIAFLPLSVTCGYATE